MKTKKEKLMTIMDISPLTCYFTDEAGNGIVGFTATYADGTFKNITLTFCPETQAAVQSEIIAIKQFMEKSLVTFHAIKPQSKEIQPKSNLKKRRP